MSLVTSIWSITAGICLTPRGVHLRIWTRQRDHWANLVFSISAATVAGYTDLTSTNWVPLTNGLATIGAKFQLAVPTPVGGTFYRLTTPSP